MIETMNKNAHAHIQFCQRVANLFLLISGPIHHSIILDCPKTRIIREFNLVDEIVARTIFEHAVMYCIIQVERFVGELIRRLIICKG